MKFLIIPKSTIAINQYWLILITILHKCILLIRLNYYYAIILYSLGMLSTLRYYFFLYMVLIITI